MATRAVGTARARASAVPVQTGLAALWPWGLITCGMVLGYLLFGRTFAYLGLPMVSGQLPPIFIGEIVLLSFLFLKPEVTWYRALDGLVRRTLISGVAWGLYLVAAYGLFVAIRGAFAGYPKTIIAQELVFNVYPLYVLLGLWLGEQYPDLLSRFIRVLAWANGIYGLAYIGFLNGVIRSLPGAPIDIPLFGKPWGQAVAVLGLLALERNLRKHWLPFTMNAAVVLLSQTRAHWAGLLLALPLWGLMTRRFGKLVIVSGSFIVLLVVGYATDVTVPSVTGVNYSARDILAGAVAPFDEQLAARYSESARHFAGTADWRRDWWRGIWQATIQDPVTFTMGHGYGFQLTSTADLGSSDPTLRTPHNVFFFALGYGGWFGVLTYAFLMAALGRLLWRAYRRTGQAFGLPFLVLCIGIASFTNFMETPFAAIPFYVIVGMSAAPALRPRTDEAPAALLA
jgi:hypothetical protein